MEQRVPLYSQETLSRVHLALERARSKEKPTEEGLFMGDLFKSRLEKVVKDSTNDYMLITSKNPLLDELGRYRTIDGGEAFERFVFNGIYHYLVHSSRCQEAPNLAQTLDNAEIYNVTQKSVEKLLKQ